MRNGNKRNAIVLLVEGLSVMTKLSAVFAVAFAAAVLIASTTYGRVDRHPTPAQLAPLEMMTGQHLSSTPMTDYSLVYDGSETK
jgi:hypothetical protein